MPTPNDYSNVQFSGKAPEEYGQTEGPQGPAPQSGDYPRTFDSGYGEHYTPQEGNYPQDYSRITCSGTAPSEYGQATGQISGPYPGSDIVAPNVPSKQFSSDHDGDPRALARASGESQGGFANLQEFLNNSLETMGCRVVNPQTKPYKPPHGAEGE